MEDTMHRLGRHRLNMIEDLRQVMHLLLAHLLMAGEHHLFWIIPKLNKWKLSGYDGENRYDGGYNGGGGYGGYGDRGGYVLALVFS